ncbi:MAG TPA: beta-(1-6) glucans synthase [Xanthobacteraceae bacterium]|nr:beta-(1-6) glucans synthase [Xanthobacteraceae bacterium]
MSGSSYANAVIAALASFALTALAIAAAWWWLGAAVVLPLSPLAAGKKLYCVSYAPFRAEQTPLVEGTRVPPAQIDEDLKLLSRYANCVRTYSVDDGLDEVLESARRYGLKVLHGVWISNKAVKTRRQIATTITLANDYSDVIAAVIVGNEVLLRGEMSATDLMATIRAVKAQVPEPVTYADVWEYWLRYPDVQNAVDFVTIHILPYWEDFPIPAAFAAAHVAAIRAKVAAAFPGKEIVIGELGWPSAGRMREGARPSPVNQAHVILETLALAERENFRVNVIEAFDQPWKRALEGAAGGSWGIFDRATGAPKFSFAGSVSDHPHWVAQALAGIALAALAFSGAFAAGRRKGFSAYLWPRIAALAFLSGTLFGWTIETVPVESFSIGSSLRSLAFAATAAIAPVVCAVGYAAGRASPPFSELLNGSGRRRDWLDWALGGTLIALTLLSVEAALGLVFDPRYRDIPFAPLTAAAASFLLVAIPIPRPAEPRAVAESVAACVLALSAGYIVLNESFSNWQSVWLCTGLICLAFILARARDVPSPG